MRFNSAMKQRGMLTTYPFTSCLNTVKENQSCLKVLSFDVEWRESSGWIVAMVTEKCECTLCHQKMNFRLLNTAWYFYLVITQPLRLTIRIWQPRVWDLPPPVNLWNLEHITEPSLSFHICNKGTGKHFPTHYRLLCTWNDLCRSLAEFMHREMAQ